MTDLSAFPITARWPAKDPSVIQLYSYPTPNGIKVSTMLEETGLAYEAHKVTLADADVKSPEFLSLNPNNKIPAIVDPEGPDGTPMGLFESGAILIYLAEKTGQFLSTNPRDRAETIQWLMWQMGGVGPFFGQLGFFLVGGGKDWEDKRPLERYRAETRRLLDVLEKRLDGRDWIMGDYSIADMAVAPWVRVLLTHYHAESILGWDELDRTRAYLDRFLARPAVQKSVNIPPRD